MTTQGSVRRSPSGKKQSYQARALLFADQTTLAAGANVAAVWPVTPATHTFLGLDIKKGDTLITTINDGNDGKLSAYAVVLSDYNPSNPATPNIGVVVQNGSSGEFTFPDDGLDITVEIHPYDPKLELPGV